MRMEGTSLSAERHTGEAYRKQMVVDLEFFALTFDDIHAKVYDQRNKIKKPLRGLSVAIAPHSNWIWP